MSCGAGFPGKVPPGLQLSAWSHSNTQKPSVRGTVPRPTLTTPLRGLPSHLSGEQADTWINFQACSQPAPLPLMLKPHLHSWLPHKGLKGPICLQHKGSDANLCLPDEMK